MRFLFILCKCADALGPPQQVRAAIVNQTNINVTWSRPDGTGMVDTYTVRLYYTCTHVLVNVRVTIYVMSCCV